MKAKPAFDTATIATDDQKAYETFIRWYEQEQSFGPDLDPDERHCMGIAQAIRAVYNLGQSAGYTRGYKDAMAENMDGMSAR